MKYRILLTTVLLLSTALVWAASNPNVQSPIGSPTSVPSAGRSGLIPSRPFDTSAAADVVSGHVGGMRHFRGTLPFSSSNIFSGPGATSPVDNFLRRSYDPILHDRSPGLSRSYSDPRRAVGSLAGPEGTGLFSPTITDRGQTDPYTPPMLAQTVDTQYRPRPLSLSGSELERLMGRQMQLREEMETERRRTQTDEQDIEIIEDIRTTSPFFQDYLRIEEVEPLLDPQTRRILEREPPAEEPDAETEVEPLPEETVRQATREEFELELLQDATPRVTELLRPREELGDAPEQTEALTPEEAAQQAAEQEQAAMLMRRYGDFDKLAEARVAEYMAAAEAFLKEGRFYKAADAFALAAIWGPNDVRPFVGQAVSLLAAGEYMSSAYLLRQAILKNPNVASAQINPAALIGDRDVFENRLIEMATWQQRSGSGELAFLIAYVMHHDGKPRGAVEAIRFAVEKMPDDKAVQILRDVIVP